MKIPTSPYLIVDMSLPNPSMSFSPFAILTAEEMNDIVENIESLSNGTGFEPGAIGTDTLAESAVTSSKTNFPWTAWTPAITGFSAAPAGGVYRYKKVGKTVTIACRQPNNGTSNSTAFLMTLPFRSANIPGMEWQSTLNQIINNGTLGGPGLAYISSDSDSVVFTRDSSGTAWTASGGKRFNTFLLTYECA